MKELGIYIHIPFCKSKCHYCDFISFSNKQELEERYINVLNDEIIKSSKKIDEEYEVTTIYIGGGTPSFVCEKNIEKLLKTVFENYKISKNAEITIEINPGTASEEKIKKYKQVGINRISLGLQSTNNKLLKQIGRIHTYEEFLNTYNIIKEEFNNINVDLMLGLPNQTMEDLKDSLNEVIELQPQHISIYSLIVEEGTLLQKMLEENKISLPSEDLERKMYWLAKETLEEKGYNHYEISNFAKDGYKSIHNLNCWEQKEYLGFGVAAHSYIDNKRISNIDIMEEYIKNIEDGCIEKNRIIQEQQNEEEKKKEYMLLGLRKIEGIKIQDFKNRYVDNPLFLYYKELEKLVNENLIEIDGDYIKLTKKGLDLANLVWEEFI